MSTMSTLTRIMGLQTKVDLSDEERETLARLELEWSNRSAARVNLRSSTTVANTASSSNMFRMIHEFC